MISIPDHQLGRVVDLGEVVVTEAMIAAYASAVGDTSYPGLPREAPPTFCLALRRGMTPAVPLPPDVFGVYGGHDLEFVQPIRAGARYAITGCVAEVYEKVGRSGRLTVIVRTATIRDSTGAVAVRITERQILRKRPPAGSSPATE